jgi:predicted N-acetyltransferase YhbS
MTLQLRPATPSDAEACGRIIHRAFRAIAGDHGIPSDFPSAQSAPQLAESLIDSPTVYGVVAEREGRFVGSNFLHEDDGIRGVGPITVDLQVQGLGIGRGLMKAVLERAKDATGVRLLQDGFNMRSLALYASLGFEVREPVAVLRGRPAEAPPSGTNVRAMVPGDLAACDDLCRRVHGISRRREVESALQRLAPLVAERDGVIAAYMTAPTFWIANHGVAASEEDLRTLIAGAAAASEAPLSFLLSTRQAALFRWCLTRGMQAVKPMTLMSKGDYHVPQGAYMPSVFY